MTGSRDWHILPDLVADLAADLVLGWGRRGHQAVRGWGAGSVGRRAARYPPPSCAVLTAWHGPHAARRLGRACVPPCDLGVMWSQVEAAPMHPGRRIWQRQLSRRMAMGRFRLYSGSL